MKEIIENLKKTKIFIFFTEKVGLDLSVIWILINKMWSLVKGPLITVFQIIFLTPEEQGVWYTFVSLGALTAFAELGFTQIITQFVSHEYAHLRYENGKIEGEKYCIDRLFSLIRYALKFYLIIIPLAVIILSFVGVAFFKDEKIFILLAWFLYSLAGGLNLFVSLLQGIYQGLNKVQEVQKNIFIGSIVLTVINLATMALGFGVYSLVFCNLISCIIMLILLYRMAPEFWKQIISTQISTKFSWFNEIISLQWKYAVSWASLYFIYQMYVPTVYKIDGSVLSGKLGVSLAIIAALRGVAEAFLVANVPKYNMLVELKKEKELETEFKKAFITGNIVYILGSIMLMLIIYFGRDFDFINRFLDFKMYFLLIMFNIPCEIINMISGYLRAHKEEPLYRISLITGISILIILLFVYPNVGLTKAFLLINLIYWFILLPVNLRVVYKCRDRYLGLR